MYKYRLTAYVSCGEEKGLSVYSDRKRVIGYSASRGTIMGKVYFESGNTALKDVDVRIAMDETSLINKGGLAYTRLFGGGKDRLPLAPGLKEDFWKGDWTVQFLLYPSRQNELKSVFYVPGYAALTMRNDTIFMGNYGMKTKVTDYSRLVLRHTGNTLMLGVAETPADTYGDYCPTLITLTKAENDTWLKQLSLTTFEDDATFGACIASNTSSFTGYLDEVRFWQKSLTNDEIRSTYNRYLTGNESDLVAYYNFDSGVVEQAFDSSHPNGVPNNRHVDLPVHDNKIFYPGVDSNMCPDEDILCYRGISDKNGEYQIAGIPYYGEGTNYMVVPVYGTHEFQPAETRRYVSASSLTHTGVDFADVSSFPVPIQVYYAHGHYPVKNALVCIDGAAVSRNGENVRTDEEGYCIVDVPIGKHKLTVSMGGHTFVNDGYPCSIDEVFADGSVHFTKLQDNDNLIDFQSTPSAAFTFFDQTMARLAGRIVGGNIESELPVGAKKSHANIGKAKLELTPKMVSGHNINGQTFDIKIGSQYVYDSNNYKDSIQSTTLFQHESSKIVITTDSISGEYLAWLPPMEYVVNDVYTVGDKSGRINSEMLGIANSSNTIILSASTERKDTIPADSINETKYFKYNAKKSYTYYNDPVLSVINPLTKDKSYPQMYGDSVYVYNYIDDNNEYKTDIIRSWNPILHDGSKESYLIDGYPIFTQNNKYEFDIRLYESYINRDTGKEITYNIPGVEMTINNTLCLNTAYTLETPETGFTYTLAGDSLASEKTGTDGLIKYIFTAGLPNPTPPYTLGMSITYETNGRVYTYPEEGILEGRIMGYVPIPGTDFVTAGPDMVQFVLRDPPGSSSYSYIEQGTTVNSSFNWEWGWNVSGTVDVGWGRGVDNDQCIITGIPMSGQAKVEFLADVKFESSNSTDHSISVNISGGQTSTMSFTTNNRLSTSSSSSFVGSDGDLYCGVSTNLLYSKSYDLGIVKDANGNIEGLSGEKYTFTEYESDGFNSQYTTAFTYSQRHLLNELIPNLRKLRRSLVKEVENLDAVPTINDSPKSLYYVKTGVSDEQSKWVSGIDYKYIPSSQKKNDEDSVMVFTNYICNWENVIAQNEQTKYEAPSKYKDRLTKSIDAEHAASFHYDIDYGYMGNVSFDGGAAQSVSITRNNSLTGSVKNGESLGFTYKHDFGFDKKLVASKTARQVGLTVKLGTANSNSFSGTESQTQTFGYYLGDNTADNYFSVDTYLPGVPSDGDNSLHKMTVENSTPSFDEFFVFRLRGGQSRCPYEKAEESLYYQNGGKSVKLSDGTIPIENPKITFSQPTYADVPNGEEYAIPVTLTNESSASVKTVPLFNFVLEADSNPDGLEFTLDGVPIGNGNGYDIYLLPGQSVQKTLIVRQTKKDVLDYENIVFGLYSDCQATRYVDEAINIYFKPVSSPVEFKQSTTVVNLESPSPTVDFTVSDYNMKYDQFAGINIQHRTPGAVNWDTDITLVNDSLLIAQHNSEFPSPYVNLEKDGSTTVSVDMSGLADGEYLFRAQCFSYHGNEMITNNSQTLSVSKDTKAPEVFQKPLAYYDGTKDIEIQFSEPLDERLIVAEDFVVTGVLNDAEVTHSSGLHFEGNAPAKTNSRVDIFGANSTVAFWYKPVVGKQSCLFSQIADKGSSKEKKMALYYNADGTMTMQLGDNSYTSTHKAISEDGVLIDDWMYAAVAIDRANSTLDLYNLFGTSDGEESSFLHITDANIKGADTNVPLYVGGSAWDDSSIECHAEMECLAIYDSNLSIAEIAADKSNRHEDNTRCLLAYWPMDEGEGDVAKDIVRQRNLLLSGTDNWYRPAENYVLSLDNTKRQYMNINTASCPIGKTEDYVLEFWFRNKGKVTAEQTIFSNGWGGKDSKEDDIDERFSVSLGTAGQMIINAKGNTLEFGSGYNDEQWHHFAMNVERDAYITVLVDTIDVSQYRTFRGDAIGGFNNAKMTLGALRYLGTTDGTTSPEVLSNYFNGEIDEVRIWNSHKTNNVVNRRTYDRLTGSEPGLVAYYPFEFSRLVAQQQKTYKSLADHVIPNSTIGTVTAEFPELVGFTATADTTALAEEAVVVGGPNLRAADFRNIVTMEWKSNGTDKVILSFPATLPKSRIEGCTLTLTAMNVRDLAGNRMAQPYTWNVYVQQNPLSWSMRENSIKQVVGETTSATITIVNKSRVAQFWSISNIPDWATLSQTSGSINPLGVTTITLTTKANTPIGRYQNVMYISDSQDLSAALHLGLTVTNIKPDWTPDVTDGAVWMSMLSRLKVDGNWATSEDDLIAVFSTLDGKCLAVANPEYNEDMDMYYTQINIKGNAEHNGKGLVFNVWDSTTGLIYSDVNIAYYKGQTLVNDTMPKLVDRAVLGNFTSPYIISTSNTIRQIVSLKPGWNWMSVWVKNEEPMTAAQMLAPVASSITEIKERFNAYSGDEMQNLVISPAQSYHIYATDAVKFEVEGDVIDPQTVQMAFDAPGTDSDVTWQWIGFPLCNAKTLGEAFADFKPSLNDVLKSLDDFSMYNGRTWIGSLQYLTPGQGYLYGYHGSEDNEWHYPSQAKSAEGSAFALEVNPYYYEDYTSVTAYIYVGGSLFPDNYQIAAYGTDGRCHGIGNGKAGQPVRFSIYGDNGDTFTFRLRDLATKGICELNGEKAFDSTTPCQSITFYDGNISGIEDIISDTQDGYIYNLGGARQNRGNLPKGVYIQNNRKIVR